MMCGQSDLCKPSTPAICVNEPAAFGLPQKHASSTGVGEAFHRMDAYRT